MEQKGQTKELHRLTENEAEILAELFRYGVARKLEIAIKDSTPNIVTAMKIFYICHRQGIFSHRLKAPKFSRYDATAGIFIPTNKLRKYY
ncbi:MAG: hypothetical protein K5664_01520 [Firmicutes bacterium]|nr:hypothetical protein [Bacillota bacterium]